MVADVADVARSYGDEQCGVNNATQEDCEADAKCSFITEYDDQGQAQQPHCSLNYAAAAAVDGVPAALADTVSTRSRGTTSPWTWVRKDATSYRTRRRASRADFASGEYTNPAAVSRAPATPSRWLTPRTAYARMSPPRRSGASRRGKNVSASNACFDAPLVNVVVEQNACYRAPKWFSDRESPASGVARAGNFDPSTAWRAFDAFDEDDTSVDDVIADAPETLGHVLLDDAAFDVGVDSWAHRGASSRRSWQIPCSPRTKEARGPRAWAPEIAIVRAAHVARNITAGPFTRGDAAATLSSPEETFKAADLTGAEIKALLTAGATASDSTQFAFAAGARFSFNSITPAASGFQVLADGSDESGRRSILRRRTRWSSRDLRASRGRRSRGPCGMFFSSTRCRSGRFSGLRLGRDRSAS